ncbi:GGDEF domain-containing protein [Desulfovibrio sp. OttesenSCG-928-C06]|nr:GGDEF domain-containing protein [Desulfovibrio sp. OttesenSCG-928-C06]
MSDKTHPAVRHMDQLINSAATPELTDELSADPMLVKLHEQLTEIREFIIAFAKGNPVEDIKTKGHLAGCVKTLQANLRHLTWQVRQIEQGDFTQRSAFLGDFSESFNCMAEQLETTVGELRKKEEELTELNESLRREIGLRTTAMRALQASEARFKFLAGHDSLTGVYNRRSFSEEAVRVMHTFLDKGRSCCVAMLDVDNFKDFNDSYGHLAGDAALQHVVRTVRSVLRRSDLLGRYGGEEFMFCFGGAGYKQGMELAERIRSAIADNALEWEEQSLNVTASLGVCHIPPPSAANVADFDSFFELVIKEADKNMYTAKQNGRNRVMGSSFATGQSL